MKNKLLQCDKVMDQAVENLNEGGQLHHKKGKEKQHHHTLPAHDLFSQSVHKEDGRGSQEDLNTEVHDHLINDKWRDETRNTNHNEHIERVGTKDVTDRQFPFTTLDGLPEQ